MKQSTKKEISCLICPNCGGEIDNKIVYSHIGRRAGSRMTPKKLASNRRNALKGGRPKGSKNKSDP